MPYAQSSLKSVLRFCFYFFNVERDINYTAYLSNSYYGQSKETKNELEKYLKIQNTKKEMQDYKQWERATEINNNLK